MKKEKKGKEGKPQEEAAAGKPILRIRNKFGGTRLNWGKIDLEGPNPGGNHYDETDFDFNKYDYIFPISNAVNLGKVLFFAGINFSHYVAVIPDSTINNGIRFKIGQITMFDSNPTTPDINLTVRAQDNEGEVERVPFAISDTAMKDVEVSHGGDNNNQNVRFSWKLNAASQNDIVLQPNQGPQPVTGNFKRTDSMEFYTDASNSFRVTILFKAKTPAIIITIRNKDIELKLRKNPHIPNTINITIEPDIP